MPSEACLKGSNKAISHTRPFKRASMKLQAHGYSRVLFFNFVWLYVSSSIFPTPFQNMCVSRGCLPSCCLSILKLMADLLCGVHDGVLSAVQSSHSGSSFDTKLGDQRLNKVIKEPLEERLGFWVVGGAPCLFQSCHVHVDGAGVFLTYFCSGQSTISSQVGRVFPACSSSSNCGNRGRRC